jgi:hypothetical protein
VTTAFGDFGPPPDAVAWVALALAVIIAVVAASGERTWARALDSVPRGWVLAVLGGVAAGLSWLYVVVYLRGGPRIVDATTYFLQARALAEGKVAFPVPVPSGAFRGRFLLADPLGHTLSAIFPPG